MSVLWIPLLAVGAVAVAQDLCITSVTTGRKDDLFDWQGTHPVPAGPDGLALGARWKNMANGRPGDKEAYAGLFDLGDNFAGTDFRRTEVDWTWPNSGADQSTGWMPFSVTYPDFSMGEVNSEVTFTGTDNSADFVPLMNTASLDYGGKVCALMIWLKAPDNGVSITEVRDLALNGEPICGPTGSCGAFSTMNPDFAIRVLTGGIDDGARISGDVRFTAGAGTNLGSISSERANLEILAGHLEECVPCPTEAPPTPAPTPAPTAAPTEVPEGSAPGDLAATMDQGAADAQASLMSKSEVRSWLRLAHPGGSTTGAAAMAVAAAAAASVGLLAVLAAARRRAPAAEAAAPAPRLLADVE